MCHSKLLSVSVSARGGGETNGAHSGSGLAEVTNGYLYGTTTMSESAGVGTIYSWSVGFGDFAKTQRTSGKVGAAVNILVTGPTVSAEVTFNGTGAGLTVVSDSEN
jgi:hypothetical protein